MQTPLHGLMTEDTHWTQCSSSEDIGRACWPTARHANGPATQPHYVL